MRAGRGEADENIARFNVLAGQQRAALRRANGKAGQIIIAARIKPRHFRRLAADQCAAGLPTALCDAFDNLRALVRIKLAGGEIVEEEQRLRPLHDKVVDAHGDKVDADRRMQAGFDGDFDLCSNAVIGCDQNRIGETCRLKVKQPAKPANFPIRAGTARRADCGLDPLNHQIAGIDVNARVGIGQAVLEGHGCGPGCTAAMAWRAKARKPRVWFGC